MLPKDERLRKDKEIKSVLKKKEIEADSPLLHLIAATGNVPKARLAVIASRKVGNAVVRNRIRRRIFAAYREIKHKIAKNYDMVLIPKNSMPSTNTRDLLSELTNIFKKARLV